MKRIISILCAAVAAAALLTLPTSCEKPEEPAPIDNPGDNPGDDSGKENPDNPNPDDPQNPDNPSGGDTSATITLDDAYGYYYGDYAGNGTTNFYLAFCKGEIDEDGYYIGEAVEVCLDIYFPAEDKLESIFGKKKEFKAANTWAEYTFDLGSVDEEDYIYGSYIYTVDAEGNEGCLLVTSGSASVTLNGIDEEEYALDMTISMTIKCDDGNTYNYEFSGLVYLIYDDSWEE